MTFDVEVDGERYVVTIKASRSPGAASGAPVATVRRRDSDTTMVAGGPPLLTVDAHQTDLGWSLVYEHDGRSVDAAVTERAGGEVLVQLPHVDITTLVDGRRYRRHGTDAHGAGQQRLCAPMPGRVLRVLVGVGDQVVTGQAVMVIEAMKMENELKALRAGVVGQVCVTEADSVEAGRLLMVVEEADRP